MENPAIALGYYLAWLQPIFASMTKVFASDTHYIEIGYGETKNINIGMMNLENKSFTEINQQYPMFIQKSFWFIVDDLPGEMNNESWSIKFTPDIIHLNSENTKQKYEVNVTISLNVPPIGKNAVKSGVIRIRQATAQQFGDMWQADWIYGLLFGNVGGTVNQPPIEKMQYVDILVRVKPYHKLDIETPPVIKLNPNQIAAVPLKLTNLGNYKDTIGFRIVSDNKDITLIDPVDITLKPGEETNTFLGIGVSPNIIDFGTLQEIKIQAFSLEEPDKIIAETTVILETQGVYISGYTFLFIIIFIVIIILIYLLLSIKRKKHFQDYQIKPDKPWNIPEERKYLDKLKKEDKEKYNKTLNMMADEYNSALLFCKDIYYSEVNKLRIKKKKELTKEAIKPKKEEPKKRIQEVKKEEIIRKKEEIKPIKDEKSKIEIKKPLIINKNKEKLMAKREIIQKNKQKAIKKIIMQQKRQKKKIDKYGGGL